MVCHYVKWHAEQRDDKISFLPCLFSGDDNLKPQTLESKILPFQRHSLGQQKCKKCKKIMRDWLEYHSMTEALAFSIVMQSCKETDMLRCRVASFQYRW